MEAVHHPFWFLALRSELDHGDESLLAIEEPIR